MVTFAAWRLSKPRGRRCNLLVIAPHPDDETLGAGALIRQASDEGWYAGTIYLTDGGASHPTPTPLARARLVARRRREALSAVSILTGSAVDTAIHLGWRDAEPYAAGTPGFRSAVARVSAFCRWRRVGMIAVTSARDTHCDHRSAAELARQVQAANGAVRIVEYSIWSSPPTGRTHRHFRTGPLAPGIRRRALRSHRSQMTAAAGPGFRLENRTGWTATHDLLVERR